MITSLILTIFNWTLSGFIFLLPTVTGLPATIDNALEFFSPYWSSWNSVVPLNTTLQIFSIIATVELGILAFHLTDWIYKKIRG